MISPFAIKSISQSFLPSQVNYVCSKTKELVAELNKSSSSADRLLNYLRQTEGLSYIVLTDDGNGGLLAKCGKGRPKASLSSATFDPSPDLEEITVPVPSSYCSEQSKIEVSALRKGMTLSEQSKTVFDG